MKKTMSILLAAVLLMSIALTAYAASATFTNFTLMNGVNGKQQTPAVVKATGNNHSSKTEITDITGATEAAPMVARVRRGDGSVASTSFDIVEEGPYYQGWYSGFGYDGDMYYLRMQNTTNGPTIVVSGVFTP